jgi:hypothetical protein
VLSGKNVVGQKVTPQTVGTSLVTPLAVNEIYTALTKQGMPQGAALAILAFFGMGVQNYEEKKR